MRCRVILAVAALALGQTSWASGASAEVWLKRMTDSHRALNYQGVVTYQVDDRLSSFKVSHIVVDGREYESLEALSHGEHEVIRQGHELSCVHIGPQLLHLLSGDSREARQLQKLYSLSLRDSGSVVAGRSAVRIAIEPKDIYRLGYRIDLDKETGLLLRSEILNQRGKVLERFEYVVLDLSVTETALDTAAEEVFSHTARRDADLGARADWQVSWLPEGFAPLRVADDVASVSYTDGLAVFTVFVEPLEGGDAVSDSHMRRGASVSYSHIYSDRGRRVSVVGEVPMLTARQVARALEWPEQ